MVAVECWPAAMAASDVQLVEVVGDASHLQMIVTANVMVGCLQYARPAGAQIAVMTVTRSIALLGYRSDSLKLSHIGLKFGEMMREADRPCSAIFARSVDL